MLPGISAFNAIESRCPISRRTHCRTHAPIFLNVVFFTYSSLPYPSISTGVFTTYRTSALVRLTLMGYVPCASVRSRVLSLKKLKPFVLITVTFSEHEGQTGIYTFLIVHKTGQPAILLIKGSAKAFHCLGYWWIFLDNQWKWNMSLCYTLPYLKWVHVYPKQNRRNCMFQIQVGSIIPCSSRKWLVPHCARQSGVFVSLRSYFDVAVRGAADSSVAGCC